MIPLCFFDKNCIAKRNEAEAKAKAELQQQQALLQQISNQSTGGLSAWAITGIVVGLAGITFLTIYYIKKSKKK